MSLPNTSLIEIPILHELIASGSADNVHFLYERLIAYFPQISEGEISDIKNGSNKSWRKYVQTAGKNLETKKLIRRERGHWTISEKGKETVEVETSGFGLTKTSDKQLSHLTIQQMLVEIGLTLGFHAETEFEYYDVIWRETKKSARISHIFEVQHKGNIDSAFAKLKRAHEAQRSKPFLVIFSEKDLNRARKSLRSEFQDIESAVIVLTFAQIKLVYQNLNNIAEIIGEFLIK